MKWHMMIVLIVLAVAAGWASRGVQATPLGIPASVYPPGAHIGYRPILTNADMDCIWGFLCESGLPNFHVTTQDALHRIDGWAQFAGIQRRGRTTMAFELFVSRYDSGPDLTGTPWSERAFGDLRATLHAQGYLLDRRHTDLLPAAREGGALVAVQHAGVQDLVVMATWSGALEVEGIALYDHRPLAARQTAWTSLALQIHLASNRGS